MNLSDQGGVPPARIRGEQRVTPLELFFDLVFVFALTQVTGFLSTHLTWLGMLQGAALLMVAHDALRGRVKPLSVVSLGTERTKGGENDGDQRTRYRSHPPARPAYGGRDFFGRRDSA